MFNNIRLKTYPRNPLKRFLSTLFCIFFMLGIPNHVSAEKMDYRALDEVILTIAYEASNQSLEGQIAVASVIKTRVKDRRWSNNPYDVVIQPYQFSCWKDGKPTQRRKVTDKEYQTAKKAWELAEAGEYNHYAVKTLKPYWINSSIKQKTIGNHTFYKL